MADIGEEQQQQQHSSDVVQVIDSLTPTVPLTPEGDEVATVVEEVDADILQQAIGVAVNSLQQETIEYDGVDGVVSIVEESDGCVTAMVTNVDDTDNGVATLVDNGEAVDGTSFETSEYRVCIDETVAQIAEFANNAEELCQNEMVISHNPEGAEVQSEQGESIDLGESTQVYSLQSSEIGEGEGLRLTIMPNTALDGAPLGSSQNPIRIIQQGNQYTPVQHLSTDQLSQIMQVVQQQQLAKTTQEGGGSSTLYNPDTNTRIVYRVIYPSELHKNSNTNSASGDTVRQALGQQTVNIVQKRTYKKRRLEEDDDDKADIPELSREEKEERKKRRPRTRSGRVSKPPKHMVKDYKHIHPLDWDEDPYDDSDGGYSDFKYSEEERAKENEDSNDMDFSAGLSLSRPKKWKCRSCEKSYIGRGGLSRHYMLNPDHGKESDLPSEQAPAQDGAYEVTNGVGFSGNFSEDSNTQDSLTPLPATNTSSSSTALPNTTAPPPVKKARGWPKGLPTSAAKRKRKLKEFLKLCTDEELMEQVLPRLSKVITLWEFLLMKVEKGSPARPHVADAYREFEGLHKKVQSMCQSYLRPLTNGQMEADPYTHLQITDADVANSLGLEVGTYGAKTIDSADESFYTPLRGQKLASVIPHPKLEGPRLVEVLSPGAIPGHSTKHIVINPPAKMSASPGAQAQLVRVSAPPIVSTVVRPQTSAAAITSNGQTVKPGLGGRKSRGDHGIVISTSLNNSAMPQPRVAEKTSLLYPPPKSLARNTPRFQVIPSSAASSSYSTVSSVNSPTVIPLQAGKPAPVPSLSLTNSPSAKLTTQGPSTQITIPVMLPQGTEQISLELPSSLAGTILDNSITQMSPGITASSNASLTDSTTVTTTTTGVLSDGAQVLLDTGFTSQSLLPQSAAEASVVTSLPMTTDESHVVHLQGFGDVQLPEGMDPAGITQFVQHDADITALENGTEVLTEDQLVEGQIISGSNIFQTEDGIIIVQNPDGTTLQLQGGQSIPLETVQALLTMEGEGQTEQGQVEVTELGEFPT